MTAATHHLPSRPQQTAGVPLVEGAVVAGCATLLMLPVVVVSMASAPALAAMAAVAVVASLLVVSRRAATGADWVAVRRFGRWSVLPAASLVDVRVRATDHGGRLVLQHADGSRLTLRRAEAVRLRPAIGAVVAQAPCATNPNVLAAV